MTYITIEKQRYYFRLNAGAQKNVEAMIFIHGSGGDGSVWEYQFSELSTQHPVIIPDLPGHGNSEGPLLSTAKEYARWLAGAVDSLKLSSFILVGHSMGGAIAQEYARWYPEKLTGLILAGTGIRFQIPEEYRRIIQTSFETAVRTSCDNAYTLPVSQELYQKGYDMLMRNEKKPLSATWKYVNILTVPTGLSRYNKRHLLCAEKMIELHRGHFPGNFHLQCHIVNCQL
ncbi:MAG: alpha/beta hydrolase [SAR324 cluster bacterium]|nr:alpha/beta hydrolase [SAR324 cluster bacterium]